MGGLCGGERGSLNEVLESMGLGLGGLVGGGGGTYMGGWTCRRRTPGYMGLRGRYWRGGWTRWWGTGVCGVEEEGGGGGGGGLGGWVGLAAA